MSIIPLFFSLASLPCWCITSFKKILNDSTTNSVNLGTYKSLWDIRIVFLDSQSDSDLAKEIQKNQNELRRLPPSLFKDIRVLYLKGSWETRSLELFLQDLQHKRTPNKKTILILYGHGLGFDGMDGLDSHTLRDLLPKVDILWFDSCFMANLELAYELRHQYRYLLASQDAEFSTGIPYETLLQLYKIQSVESAAMSLADSFLKSYSKEKNGSQSGAVVESSATISVIDSESWDVFALYLKKIWPEILSSAREFSEQFGRSFHIARMDQPRLLDLGAIAQWYDKRTHNRDLSELLDLREVKRAKAQHDFDYVLLRSTQSDNPVKFFGYTLRIGRPTKSYSGLNVLDPLQSPSFSYLELDYARDFLNPAFFILK